MKKRTAEQILFFGVGSPLLDRLKAAHILKHPKDGMQGHRVTVAADRFPCDDEQKQKKDPK